MKIVKSVIYTCVKKTEAVSKEQINRCQYEMEIKDGKGAFWFDNETVFILSYKNNLFKTGKEYSFQIIQESE